MYGQELPPLNGCAMSSERFTPKTYSKPERPFEVYDIETSIDLAKCYLVGWYDGKFYRYWESMPLPPDNENSAVSQFCAWYFLRRPPGPIYAHNGGNFDHLYILRWLLRHIPKARIEFIPTQSSILLMTVWVGKRKYEFRDSMRLMVAGLDDIAKTLLGQGKVTGIDYETLHNNPRRYEYLQRDCVALFDCIVKFRDIVTKRLGGAMGLTAAATAIETLRTGYLQRSIGGLTPIREKLIREAYYGGRTEVFHTGGTFAKPNLLNCYDVNSMYVWALAQPLPCDFIKDTRGQYWEDGDGFLECEVDTTECSTPHSKLYPILPYRHEGKLLFPLGHFRSTWATPELRLAIAQGYRITWIGRGIWFRLSTVFKSYVETLYKLRDKGLPGYDPTLSAIAKVLGNATYGKFGTNREREKIHLSPSVEDILEYSMRPLQGPFDLPVYVEECQSDASYILPHLAAWVTSLARVRLLSYIYQCYPSRVFYCDTDSVYTTATLPTGKALGEMKVEYEDITKAEFVAPKVYRLTHSNNSITTRAKGFSQFGKGCCQDFGTLASGISVPCSAMSKLRTVLRGDFGLMLRRKHLLKEGPKRKFLSDGSSMPWVIKDGELT